MFQCHKLHTHLFITAYHVIPEKHTRSNSKGMEARNISLFQSVQTSSGAYTASYSKGIGNSFPTGETADHSHHTVSRARVSGDR